MAKLKNKLRSAEGRKTTSLYAHPLKSLRTGPLFSAFPYPTKISPEAIALFIASHTRPGDTIFDGFSGSGTTGVAALLCSKPTPQMRSEARRLGLDVQWGPRRAVLCDVGVLGSMVSRTLCSPPEPEEFRREAERVLRECESEFDWIYQARDPEGNLGTVRYLIWSELVGCPNCGKHVTLWAGCVERQPARISPTFRCPHCARKTATNEMRRVLKSTLDDVLHERVTGRAREAVWLYGSTGKRDWSRPIDASDRLLLKRISQTPLPTNAPQVKIPWGDLYRSGYHRGITHLHHFYTRRNFIVFARLWELTASSHLRDALRFWLLSYNASHGTLMTRVVAKQKQRDLVVTSSQSGVLYVSGLPVERNIFSGLRRKLGVITTAFSATHRDKSLVDVYRRSCVKTGLDAESIDYVFTDPPFGGNIPYAEVNFVNEAWLGEHTNAKEEITISRAQGKTSLDYEELMRDAFKELRRILKPGGKATVVFHSSSAGIWNALHRAYIDAGLQLETTSVLDKTQSSFKQVTTTGAVKGDPVLLLSRDQTKHKVDKLSVTPVMDHLLRSARDSGDVSERSAQRMYSRFVTFYLRQNQNVPLDAGEFYKLMATKLQRDDVHRPTD